MRCYAVHIFAIISLAADNYLGTNIVENIYELTLHSEQGPADGTHRKFIHATTAYVLPQSLLIYKS